MLGSQAQVDGLVRLAHVSGQTLLRCYLRGVRDDPHLAEVSRRYVPLAVVAEPGGGEEDALSAAVRSDRSVVHGGAGMGKTTLLECLAHRCADQALSFAAEAPIPFLMDLSLLPECGSVSQLLLEAVRQYAPEADDLALRTTLERQTPLFLFDNLDRITDGRLLDALESWLSSWTDGSRSAKLIVACRSQVLPAHRPWLADSASLALLPLDGGSMTQFLQRSLPEERVRELDLQLRQSRWLWDLVRVPLFLRAIVNLAQLPGHEPLWRRRGRVVEEALRITLGLVDARDVERWLADKGRALAELALVLQGAGSGSAGWQSCVEIHAERGQRIDEPLRRGLLVLTPDGEAVGFPGAPFQEFFAARAAESWLWDGLQLRQLVRGQGAGEGWGSPIVQLYGLTADPLALIRHLLDSPAECGPVRVAARCMVANEDRQGLQERLGQVLDWRLPQATLYRLSAALRELGATEEAVLVLGNASDLESPNPSELLVYPHLMPSATPPVEPCQPGEIIRHFNLGAVHRELARGDEAVDEFRAALREADRLGARICYEMGLALQDVDNREDALDAFQQAADRQPGTGAYLYAAGVALNRLGRHTEALRKLKQAEAREPGWADVYAEIARAYRQQRWYSEALGALEQAINLAPADGALQRDAALVLARQGQPEQAVTCLERAIALNPDVASWYDELGELYGRLGRWEDAVREHELAVGLEPANAAHHYHLGGAYMRVARQEKALESLCRAAVLAPDQAEWHGDLADVLSSVGEHARALEEYREAAALAPDRADYLSGAGRSLYHLGRHDEALVELEKATAMVPSLADAHSLKGTIHEARGHLKTALNEYLLACALEPERAPYYRSLGTAYAQLNDSGRALEMLRLAGELEPDCADTFRQQAKIHQKLGADEEALAALTKALELEPRVGECQLQAGLVSQRLGRHDDALRFLAAAHDLVPGDPVVHHQLGLAYIRRGEHQKALDAFRESARLDPEKADYCAGVGLAYYHLGQMDEARAETLRALTLSPDDAPIHAQLGRVAEAERKYEEALTEYRQAITLAPREVEYRRNTASVYRQKGLYDEAKAELATGMEVAPEAAVLFGDLGHIHDLCCDHAAAMRAFDRAIALSPSEPAHHRSKGALLRKLGRPEEAIAELKAALELDAECAEAHHQLGLLFEMQARDEEALGAFRRAMELAPQNPAPFYDYGRACQRMGDPEEAIVGLHCAVALQPDWAEARYHLGQLYRQRRNPSEALKHFQEAAALVPDEVAYRRALAGTGTRRQGGRGHLRPAGGGRSGPHRRRHLR
jgi:tetratricopeptide (TPR) repeat protein